MTDPRGHAYAFSYDALGRLAQDSDPAGGFKTLARTDAADGFTVNLSTALNRTTTYQMQNLTTGNQRRTNTAPTGLQTVKQIGTNGITRTTVPDGTVTTLTQGPDPHFSMQASLPANLIITTPGGRTSTSSMQRSVTLASPTDLLSLT